MISIFRSHSRAGSVVNIPGTPKSPSYLGISYSRIEMVAKCVPGQFRDNAVILVQVMPVMREDEIGLHFRLQLLEGLLDVGADVRKEAVAEVMNGDVLLRSAGEHHPGGALCLFGDATPSH